MKRFFTVLLGVLLIAALTAPAFAWEFAMTGEAEFRYRYWSRLGSGDLFGGPNTPNALGAPGFGQTNGFAGPVALPAAANSGGLNMNVVQVQGFSAKGSDASIQDQRVWLFPEIRVNPAIRLRGEYWLTGTNLRGHHAGLADGTTYFGDNYSLPLGYTGWYIANDGTNGNGPGETGMSTGMWEKFWMTAQLPWGIFVAGRRGVDFGLGWSTVHEKDLDDETWLMVVPYGPLTFIFGSTLRDAGCDSFEENAAATLSSVAPGISPIGVGGAFPLTVAAGTDKNRTRAGLDARIAFTYRNGPVDMGWLFVPIYHYDTHYLDAVPAGPRGADDMNQSAFPAVFLGAGFANDVPGNGPMYGDIRYWLSPMYFKYFNGRFFFNAEYDWEYADACRKGGRPISTWADGWEIETGAICGPAKMTFAGFYHSGDDRRGGWLDYWSAYGGAGGLWHPGTSVYDWQTQFLVFGGAKEAINPYQYLMGIYGAGNNSFDPRGFCAFQDFLGYAARLDYAVAANLNVFSSFMYANRGSNTGTPVGAYRGGVPNLLVRPHPGFGPGYTGNYTAVGAPLALGEQIAPIPNVPDNYLGWEWDAGVNWKLLEGLTFNSIFAYWQPGDWFKWAYVDYGGSPATDATINGVTYPVNPNRGIDPIIGFQGSIIVDF